MADYQPKAVYVSDLKEGDIITVDSFYGAEIVSSIEDVKPTPSNGVAIKHIGLTWATPFDTIKSIRFVERADGEPVVRWSSP